MSFNRIKRVWPTLCQVKAQNALRMACGPARFTSAGPATRPISGTARWSRAPFHRPVSRICMSRDFKRHQSSHTARAATTSVSHTIKDHVNGHRTATIIISNPTKLNIVTSSLLKDLACTCQNLAQDASLRCVVLTGGATAPGKSPAFIGGADIKEMNELSSAQEARTFITRIHHACAALRALPVPVIARIDGFCLGAGLEVAAACDLRIATKRSVFAMPEVRVGIPSVVEAALLPGLIGTGRTRRLLYLAESIGAEEAERWGLVERVAADEVVLDGAVDEWVDAICEKGPKAIRAQKALMLRWENGTVEEGIQAGIDAFADVFADGGREPKEYMGAFLNKRK